MISSWPLPLPLPVLCVTRPSRAPFCITGALAGSDDVGLTMPEWAVPAQHPEHRFTVGLPRFRQALIGDKRGAAAVGPANLPSPSRAHIEAPPASTCTPLSVA